MKTDKILTVAVLAAIVGAAGACGSSSSPANATNTTTTTSTTTTANQTMTANQTANNSAAHGNSAATDDVPAAVKAIFTDAQSFTTQHKDIPADKIASIEKDTGGKVPEKDHHSYLALATKDGKRTQLGAATVVKAGGKDVFIVYENKNGMPTIKEVRADGVAKEFLAQFTGKNHDTKIKFGDDIKTNGADEATAKAITQAVRIDVLSMEALYGAAHSH